MEIFAGDVRDASCLDQAFEDCDIVFHLAALIGIPYFVPLPGFLFGNKCQGNFKRICKSR